MSYLLEILGKSYDCYPQCDEVSNHESKSDQKGNFIAFTATVKVSELEIVEENPSDRQLSNNADLQEAYNKLCKIEAKDAMNVKK